MENEIKNTKIEIRLTPTEKEFIKDYAKRHEMTVSDFVRMAVNRIFGQEDDLN